MERLQVYDRVKATWGTRYPVQVGFQENWVLDKTTDTAKDFVIRVPGITALAWAIMDWVRILHIPDDAPDCAATYDSEGKPINHNQYVIGAIQCVRNVLYDYCAVSLSLIEPIERFRGVVGETLTYTNQGSKTVGGVTYPHALFNHLSALERWLKVTPANCDNYAAGYNPKLNTSWYNRIRMTETDKAFLQGLSFADATYNGLSLYELLMDNYYASTGRTPVVYFDINPATDTARNASRDEYLLFFERQDGYDRATIPISDLTDGCSQVVYSRSLDNYATGVVCDVENMSSGAPVQFPAEHLYAVPEVADDIVRTTNKAPFNTDAANDNWIIKLPHAVKRIAKVCRVSILGYHGTGDILIPPYQVTYLLNRRYEDVTDTVYERKEYQALPGDPENDKTLHWYEEGGKELHIRGYFFTTNTESKPAYMYYIEYEPLLAPRVIIGDEEYLQPVNQVHSQVDNVKFGAFLEDYRAGMNKADVVVLKTYGEGVRNSYAAYNAFKDLLGLRVKNGEKEYRITAVSYRNRNYQYDVMIQLNENYFRKSANYQAGQEIRPNIGIPLDNLRARKTLLQQVVMIALTPTYAKSVFSDVGVDKERIFLSALMPGTVASKLYPQLAVIISDRYRMVTLSRARIGNKVLLSVNLSDNVIAGKSKTRYTKEETSGDYRTFQFGRVNSQTNERYTDIFGEIDTLTTYFVSADDETDLSENINESGGSVTTPELVEEFNRTDRIYQLMTELPKMPDIEPESSFCVIEQKIMLDALEILNANFAVSYVARDNNLIVCPGLLELSRLMRQSDDDRAVELRFYTENKAEDSSIAYAAHTVTPTVTVSRDCITYSFSPFTGSVKSCIIISAKDGTTAQKLLIINDIDAAVTSGELKVYFS